MRPLETGQRLLQRYRVEGYLARGGMGDVYVGRHERLGHRVAIKILHTDEVEFHRRFEHEAKLLARVQHPNVVSVIDVGRFDDRPFIVMDHVEGDALDHLLRQRRGLPWPEAIAIGAALFEGLAAIHGAGIVHRDVKPANVLVGPPPLQTVTLIDFSIALDDHLPAEGRHTARGVIIGTPDYMAPEQLLGDPIDPRTDIFAVGVCLFEMIAGRLPWDAVGDGGVASMLDRVRADAPRLLAAGGLEPPPPDVVELVADCIANDPGLRPAAASGLALQLRSLAPARASGAYIPVTVPREAPSGGMAHTDGGRRADPEVETTDPGTHPANTSPKRGAIAPIDTPTRTSTAHGIGTVDGSVYTAVPPRADAPEPALATRMDAEGPTDTPPEGIPSPTPSVSTDAFAEAPTNTAIRSTPPPQPRGHTDQVRRAIAASPLAIRVSQAVGEVSPLTDDEDDAPQFRLRAALGVRFADGTLRNPLNAQLLARLVGRRGHSIVAEGDVWVALLRSPSRSDAIRRIAHLKRFVNRRFADAESVRWTELPDACTTESLPVCLGQLLEPLRTPSRSH